MNKKIETKKIGGKHEKTLRGKLEKYIDTMEDVISVFEKMEDGIDTYDDVEIPEEIWRDDKGPNPFFEYCIEDAERHDVLIEICDEVDLYDECVRVTMNLNNAHEDDFKKAYKITNSLITKYGDYQELEKQIPKALVFFEKVIFTLKNNIKRLETMDRDTHSALVDFRKIFDSLSSAEKGLKNTNIDLTQHNLDDLFKLYYRTDSSLDTPFENIAESIRNVSSSHSLDFIDSDLVSDLIESRDMMEDNMEKRFDRTRVFKRGLSEGLSSVENTIEEIIEQLEEQL